MDEHADYRCFRRHAPNVIILEDSSSDSVGSGYSDLSLKEVEEFSLDESLQGNAVEVDRGNQGWHMRALDFEVVDEQQNEQDSMEVPFVAAAEDAHLLNIPNDIEEVEGHNNFEDARASGVSFDRMALFIWS